MARCIKCDEVYSEFYLTKGVCENCIENKNGINEKIKYKSVLITTENILDLNIEERITVISAERIYGISIVEDLFSFVRNIAGGRVRVNSLEKALSDATEQIFDEFKQKAYSLEGNAVIGIKIEHTYNNANSGSILSVFATGTVVKITKENIEPIE